MGLGQLQRDRGRGLPTKPCCSVSRGLALVTKSPACLQQCPCLEHPPPPAAEPDPRLLKMSVFYPLHMILSNNHNAPGALHRSWLFMCYWSPPPKKGTREAPSSPQCELESKSQERWPKTQNPGPGASIPVLCPPWQGLGVGGSCDLFSLFHQVNIS